METLFIVCFGVGVGYALLTFFLGEILGVIHFDADVDVGGGQVSPLKPVIIAVFLTVFGGLGMLLFPKFVLVTVFSISSVSALIVSFLFYRYIITPLYKAQNTSTFEINSLIGHEAKVSEYIPQGKYGKITYYVNSNTYSAPAKSEDGAEIKRNSIVEIVYIEKNTYYVKEIKEGQIKDSKAIN